MGNKIAINVSINDINLYNTQFCLYPLASPRTYHIRTDQSHVPLVLVTLSGIGLNCFALKNFWLEMYNSMYNSVLLTNTRSYAPEIAMIMTILRMLFGNSKLKTTK